MSSKLKALFAAFISIAALGIAACSQVDQASDGAGDIASTSVSEAKGQVVLSGSFEGRSDHITTGRVSILKTGAGYVARLESDFSLDGAPAPTLGFGKDGFVAATEFTTLNNKDGYQLYSIPANISPTDFSEFYVWCADFNVPLGVASLQPAN